MYQFVTSVSWSWSEYLSIEEWMIEHNYETKIRDCDIADSEVFLLLQLAGASAPD